MKKDQPRQARRQRALERFSIRPLAQHEDPKQYAVHLARKLTEQAALKHALGL